MARKPKASPQEPGSQLLLIEWVDSELQADHWAEPSAHIVSALPVCRSVGWVIGETPEVLNLAAHWDPKNGHWTGAIAIPVVAIASRRRLRH